MVIISFTVLSSLLAGSIVSATAVSSSRKCKDFDIPVTVTAQNGIYGYPPLTNNEEATDVAFLLSLRDAPPIGVASGYVNITGTYNINARFCTPKSSTEKARTVHFLTHGVGFDKAYWDPEVSRSKYSYIDAALDKGYSTFSYDRLGNGKSSKPNPNTVVQSFTELAILAELTRLLRANALKLSFTPNKVIHVGHSYGSALTNYLASTYPTLSDGIVLTGFSHNAEYTVRAIAAWGFQIARIQNPKKFKEFVREYFTWSNKWSNQLFFLKHPFFSTEALDYAEDNKQPVGLGSLMSLAGGNFFAAEFTGPVLLISGQYDFPFCGGNCTGILEFSGQLFPAASTFETKIHPDAGHGINLHLNAQVAYKSIFDFLSANGL